MQLTLYNTVHLIQFIFEKCRDFYYLYFTLFRHVDQILLFLLVHSAMVQMKTKVYCHSWIFVCHLFTIMTCFVKQFFFKCLMCNNM